MFADIQAGDVLLAIATVIGIILLIVLVGLSLLWRRLRQLNLPQEAGALETLRAVPLSFVVLLDLLDLSLDVFSAPISWAILTKLRLQGLRQVTTIEAVIPGTQLIPTMTLAWLFARYTGRAFPVPPTYDEGQVIEHEPPPASTRRRQP